MNNENEGCPVPCDVDPDEHASSSDEVMVNENNHSQAFEETPDTNNSNSHAPCAPIQCLNSVLPIPESVDGWIAQSTQSGQHLASSAHPPNSNLEENRQIETQLIPNPEHINHAPPALIHGLNGDLPIQETGQVFNEQLTQSQIIEVLVDNGQIEVLVITVDSTPTIVDQLY